MSESSSSEKTEEATPKKLRDARKKGQVAKSKDIPSALILLFAFIYFWMAGGIFIQRLAEIFIAIPSLTQTSFLEALSSSLDIVIQVGVLGLILPFIIMALIAGILGNIIQFGVLFSIDPIMPKMEKISPVSGFKRIFSVKQFVETLLSLVKTILIGLALVIVIYISLPEMLHEVRQCNVLCTAYLGMRYLAILMMIILPLMLLMALLDFLFQKNRFAKDQRMTKHEVKREMKEMFGDPTLVGARHTMRRELTEQDIQSRIKTARILLVDIGVAIALHYEQDVTPLPVIVAIGKAGMARKMVEIAQVEGVPIVSDGRLVSDMLEEGKLDQYIPNSTIDRVAQAMRSANR